jgi:hypothetical protein
MQWKPTPPACLTLVCCWYRHQPAAATVAAATVAAATVAAATAAAAAAPTRLDAAPCTVLRETKWAEGTMQELAAAGAPTSVSGYEDADAATAVFDAIAPQCLKKFELHELHLPGGSSTQQQ